jgi:hypothetical protein
MIQSSLTHDKLALLFLMNRELGLLLQSLEVTNTKRRRATRVKNGLKFQLLQIFAFWTSAPFNHDSWVVHSIVFNTAFSIPQSIPRSSGRITGIIFCDAISPDIGFHTDDGVMIYAVHRGHHWIPLLSVIEGRVFKATVLTAHCDVVGLVPALGVCCVPMVQVFLDWFDRAI